MVLWCKGVDGLVAVFLHCPFDKFWHEVECEKKSYKKGKTGSYGDVLKKIDPKRVIK